VANVRVVCDESRGEDPDTPDYLQRIWTSNVTKPRRLSQLRASRSPCAMRFCLADEKPCLGFSKKQVQPAADCFARESMKCTPCVPLVRKTIVWNANLDSSGGEFELTQDHPAPGPMRLMAHDRQADVVSVETSCPHPVCHFADYVISVDVYSRLTYDQVGTNTARGQCVRNVDLREYVVVIFNTRERLCGERSVTEARLWIPGTPR